LRRRGKREVERAKGREKAEGRREGSSGRRTVRWYWRDGGTLGCLLQRRRRARAGRGNGQKGRVRKRKGRRASNLMGKSRSRRELHPGTGLRRFQILPPRGRRCPF
jgi:hypothetical protein